MPPELEDAAVAAAEPTEPTDSAGASTEAAEPAEGADDATPTPAAEGDDAPEAAGAEGEGAQPEPKKKSPVAQLQGRVGHLTRSLHQRDEELARERSQREALEALLNGAGRADGEGEPTRVPAAPTSAPAPGSPEFDKLVDERAAAKASAAAFTRDCNTIFDSGVEKHGKEAFEEAVTNLNVLGLMDPQLVEAAMATDAPADVIHHLGSDVDEAARIRALPPIRMAAEIVKLAATLAKPKEQQQISRAPAPITPIGGTQQNNQDLASPNISMADHVRIRKQQGSRWAR